MIESAAKLGGGARAVFEVPEIGRGGRGHHADLSTEDRDRGERSRLDHHQVAASATAGTRDAGALRPRLADFQRVGPRWLRPGRGLAQPRQRCRRRSRFRARRHPRERSGAWGSPSPRPRARPQGRTRRSVRGCAQASRDEGVGNVLDHVRAGASGCARGRRRREARFAHSRDWVWKRASRVAVGLAEG